MNREKESIRSLEPYVTNQTICSVKLDANEGDKDLYRDLLKKLGESDITLNYYPDDSYSELKKEINNYVGYEPKNITVGNGSSELLDRFEERIYEGCGGTSSGGSPWYDDRKLWYE